MAKLYVFGKMRSGTICIEPSRLLKKLNQAKRNSSYLLLSSQNIFTLNIIVPSTGHGGILLPEKYIYKNKNNQFDETLIPLDHEMRGQIRDFNLFHHFVHLMSRGVTVTCIIDSCHSGSILHLPYRFRSNSTSGEMEEDEDTMSNLAFMFTAGGLALPEMFDGGVKENIEHTTGQKLEDLHGMHTDELNYDKYDHDNYSSSSSSTEAILTNLLKNWKKWENVGKVCMLRFS